MKRRSTAKHTPGRREEGGTELAGSISIAKIYPVASGSVSPRNAVNISSPGSVDEHAVTSGFIGDIEDAEDPGSEEEIALPDPPDGSRHGSPEVFAQIEARDSLYVNRGQEGVVHETGGTAGGRPTAGGSV